MPTLWPVLQEPASFFADFSFLRRRFGQYDPMSVCAITMVYRDYWSLAQWYAHYGRHLGSRNLFVVSHGHDPKVQEICPEASVLTIPRTSLAHFDRQRGLLLNRLQNSLSVVFDWIIRTDADELICLDPSRYENFEAFYAEQTADAIFALGLNLAETRADQQLGDTVRVLAERRQAVFTGHFSKAWAVRNRVSLMQHGVKVGPRRVEKFPFIMPEGVFLVHLKFANLKALNEANKHRREVGNAPGRGRPGTAWKQPGPEARRFFARFDELEDLPWEQALCLARAQIAQDPHRDKKLGLIRARLQGPCYRIGSVGFEGRSGDAVRQSPFNSVVFPCTVWKCPTP